MFDSLDNRIDVFPAIGTVSTVNDVPNHGALYGTGRNEPMPSAELKNLCNAGNPPTALERSLLLHWSH
jgi:hypothetical protein